MQAPCEWRLAIDYFQLAAREVGPTDFGGFDLPIAWFRRTYHAATLHSLQCPCRPEIILSGGHL